VKAKDMCWHKFSRKYINYSQFKKEWWVYQETFGRPVGDKLVEKNLEEEGHEHGCKIMMGNIESH
jgi:hypothetical protein